MDLRRELVSIALGAVLAAIAWAGNASIDVAAFPALSVADGRSTVTITATVRTREGALVPDGTRVVFTVDQGTFREPVVETRNGIARAVLQTSSQPGFAKITVSAITYQSTATIDYEYVADRSLLNTANEYIEVNSPTDLRYSMDDRTIEATGAEQTAVLTYRDIEIRADQIQVTVPSYEVRAKNARIKVGSVEYECGQAYFKLNQRVGFGTTNFKYKPKIVQPVGDGFEIIEGDERETYGVAELRGGEARAPSEPVSRGLFEMKDVYNATTMISAKKAVAYPRKEIQFSRADVYMAGARIMRLPLFKVSVFTSTPVVTDQMLKINDNSIAIDYPYYLDLAPGRSSLVRFSMGRGGSRGLSSSRGVFLDYEYAFSQGDSMQGDIILQSLGRKDWGIASRFFYMLGPSTDMNLQLDLPAHRSLYGGLNVGHQFPNYSLRFSASDGRSLEGPSFRNQTVALSLDRNPVRVGGKSSPFNFSYGVGATSAKSTFDSLSASQSTAGARGVLRLNPVYFGNRTNLTGSLNVGKVFGSNAPSGLTYLGSLAVTQGLPTGGIVLGYDYIEDGFTSSLLGRHQLSARGNFAAGRFNFDVLGIRGLDVDRSSLRLDAGYRISRDFRLSYGYTYERFLNDAFLDYFFVLGYRLGYREIGLTWSHRTKRIGFQLLGTSLY